MMYDLLILWIVVVLGSFVTYVSRSLLTQSGRGVLCFHKLTTGGGGMGDGIDCKKCGLSTYYFPWLWFYKLIGRVSGV